MTSKPAPSSVVILGGGAAGWMAANPMSWHVMLGGYGNYPLSDKLAALPHSPIDLAEMTRFVSRRAMSFPSHADALAALHTQRAA